MELRQLRYLVALADERSFTAAARIANVAQPALSRQIQKLEQELAMPLVDRTTRRVSLTPAGEDTVAAARRILAELAALTDALHQTRSLVNGTVTIGITQTPGPVDVPAMLAGFSRQHGGVDVIVREGLSVELADQLREDRLDLALISGIGEREQRQLGLQLLREEGLVALLPAGHPLAIRSRLGIADLRDERFISFPPGATIRDTVERAAVRSGFLPRAGVETSDVSRAAALVGQALGVAILPESDGLRHWPQTVAVSVAAPALRYQVFLAWRRQRHLSPAAAALKAAISAEMTAQAPKTCSSATTTRAPAWPSP